MTDAEKLFSNLEYHPDSGWFTYINGGRSKKKGGRAGWIDAFGYRVIRICDVKYKAHRLAWLYVNGKWPDEQIDHINGIRDDNRMSNIRQSTPRENSQNKKAHREGKLVGGCYVKSRNKWVSCIKINNKFKNLGYYATEIEAHLAYLNAYKINFGGSYE
jgi:hypothetical protein